MKNPIVAIISKAQPVVNAIKPMVIEKGPEVMVIAGVLGLVGAGIWACKKTADELPDILDEADDGECFINNAICEDMTEEENEADRVSSLKKLKRHTRLQIVKLYAGPVIVGTISVLSILSGNHIIKKRYVAALAGMQSLKTAYDGYRKRIVDKYGEAADKYAAYGIETEEVEIEVTDPETGKTKKTKEELDIMKDITGATVYSPYFQLIGPDSSLYRECKGNPIYMRNQLDVYEKVLNEMYDRGVPIYYNEAMKYIFGCDTDRLTDDGQIVGWYKYDSVNKDLGDQRINLRIGSIHNHNDETDKDEIWFYIDPNVFGPVRLGH